MRALSLQMDLDNEIWALIEELVQDHGHSRAEAHEMVEKSVKRVIEQDKS